VIGIFGGTFDPVHYGHIEPVLSVKQGLGLTQIRFIPNNVPPHRTAPWLSAEQRLSLLQTALKDCLDAVIDQRELNRDGVSYMVDTLESLNKEFSEHGICLIIGMDAFLEITNWHQWKRLFELCHLVVTTRPGFEQDLIAEQMSAENYQFLASRMTQDVKMLNRQGVGKILLQAVPQLDISSTQIRAKLSDGEDISQWMPADVYQKLRGFINEGR